MNMGGPTKVVFLRHHQMDMDRTAPHAVPLALRIAMIAAAALLGIVGREAHVVAGRSASPTRQFDAILVLGGGQLPDFTPPLHVELRLRRAAKLWHDAPHGRRPMIMTTSRGTPHKPSPHDPAGFEIDEADCQSRFLMRNLSIPARFILQENLALDTIGNAYFARLLHTDVDPTLRRLAIITNRWHMPRSRAVFEHMFSLPARVGGASPGYTLTFISEADALPTDVLAARLESEAKKLPRFAQGSAWRSSFRSMQEAHSWLTQEHGAYKVGRLMDPEWHKPENGSLVASYRLRD